VNARASGSFAPDAPVFVARAPGRLDLMGGNADYTGGMVFQATIRESTHAAVQLRPDDRIILINPQMQDHPAEFRFPDMTSVEATLSLVAGVRWTAYVLGVFYLLRSRYPEAVVRGATVLIESDVPLNKGVSSSAAVEVAVMKAAAAAYGVALAGIELAESCQWVENVIAQAPCGVMDQAAVVLGEEGRILPLLCQPCRPLPLVKLPHGLECFAIDSGIRHSIASAACETARAAAFIAYKMICDWENLPISYDDSRFIPRYTDPRWNGYLSNLPLSVFRSQFQSRLPESIRGSEFPGPHVDPFTILRCGTIYPVRAAARYAVEEHHRVRLFIELARSAAGFDLMGELMYQSHHAYTECGLGCDATDTLVEFARQEGLLGAKMTGGGAGGTVAVLCRQGSRDAFHRVVSRYAAYSGAVPHVFEGSSAGADRHGVQTI
jgi:galactokinase